MLTDNIQLLDAYKTPSREITGGVIVDGSTYLLPEDKLVSFTITRTAPSGKFFGFVISQKIVIEVLGIMSFPKGTRLEPYLGLKNDNPVYLPYFYVDKVEANEVGKKTVITGYDILHNLTIPIGEIGQLNYLGTLSNIARSAVTAIGGSYDTNSNLPNYTFNSALNYNVSDPLSLLMEDIAELSGTFCYCSKYNNVVFKALSGVTGDDLNKESYFELTVGEKITLTQVGATSVLQENYVSGSEGFTQVIQDNALLYAGSDPQSWLHDIYEKVAGLTLTNYTLKHRGNPYYEFGDFLMIITPTGTEHIVCILDETLTYNGGLVSTCSSQVAETQSVEASPTKIADVIHNTYAKIDKANQQIQLAVETVEGYDERISKLELNDDGLVLEVEKKVQDLDDELTFLTERVSQSMTSEDVTIQIEEAMENGVDSVVTSTGFRFDNEGLNISRSTSSLSTQITEDGMEVFNANVSMLKASSAGVNATMLNANTYLSITDDVKFMNMGNRMGCFWIGG